MAMPFLATITAACHITVSGVMGPRFIMFCTVSPFVLLFCLMVFVNTIGYSTHGRSSSGTQQGFLASRHMIDVRASGQDERA